MAATAVSPPPAPPVALGERQTFARGPVLVAMAVLALTLTLTSALYGYHRDELYFRMLQPAWGYIDQPPLTPLIVHSISALVDEPWAIRVPATASAVIGVLILVLITREVGGGRRAQVFSAWAAVSAAFPLELGHVFLTASIDLTVWPAVCLFAIRAVLRDSRWWLAAGVVIGLSTYNKLLIAMLVGGLLIGLAVFGPWRVFRSVWLYLAAATAFVIAIPNLVFQMVNGWPQLSMGAALGAENGAEVRVQMWYMLFLLVGPLLVPVWVAAMVALLRRPAWRDLRFLALALPVVLLGTFAGGSQFYYPLGVLSVLVAVGWVPVEEWMRTRGRTAIVVAAVAVNGVASVLIALPVIPVGAVGSTPIPDVNQATGDTIGWPRYVRQVASVVDAGRGASAIVTANYGEAGAISRYGPDEGLTGTAYSGQNALWFAARPPDSARDVVFVGDVVADVRSAFAHCTIAGRLDNGVDVDNEEQGEPIWSCSGRSTGWDVLWPRLAHLD